MSEPKIVQKQPFVMELEAGTYWWCACGRSANQPYCDGSHKGTEFRPVKFECTEHKRVALCGCKHTNKSPFCDGTHKQL
ncbi:MAG: CDGSH iron-sulfur domain-containing protein [Bacteroidetes bacterium]|nr:MAG: CDGSH iron-sulfur domain-containing protein [Bacteroidota bacterium]